MKPVSLLDGGAEAFPRMVEAMGLARTSIWMEVYTFALDGWGTRLCDALCEAARRGVDVRVQVDGVGSLGTEEALAARLRAAGAKVRTFNPLTGLWSGRWWRNHRKVLLVDGTVAFVGGINVSDAYAHDEAAGRRGWADVALELRGEVAAELGKRLRGNRLSPPDGPVRVWLSGLRGGLRLQGRYREALKGARQEVLLAHAYFLPSGAFVRALCAAARRGVKVRLLLAGKSDVPLARAATARLYGRLLEAGVEVREWTASTLHAKAAVVDGCTVLVGSFNLDALSLVNQEALVEVEDAGLAGEVGAWMERHLAEARDVAGDWQRMGWLERTVLGAVGTLVVRLQEAVARLLG
jgi:cardiolipin synthase